MERAAYSFLLLSVFTSAFAGVGAGRALAVVSLVLTVVDCVRRRISPRLPAVAWWTFAFVGVAVAATLTGEAPARGVKALDKLIPWVVLIPLAAHLICTGERLRSVLVAFAFGSGVLCLRTLAKVYTVAGEACRSGLPLFAQSPMSTFVFHEDLLGHRSIMASLVLVGDMHDGQRLMMGVIVTLGLLLAALRARRRAVVWAVLLAMSGIALVLTFKRGAWLCAIVGVAMMLVCRPAVLDRVLKPAVLLLRRRWRRLAALGVLLAVVVVTTPLRNDVAARCVAVKDRTIVKLVRGVRAGGRTCMWFQIAPALVRARPWLGVGFKSLTHERMREIAPQVEPRQDHLHSNIIQLLVATGVVGLAVYLLWMRRAFSDGLTFARRARVLPGDGGVHALSLLVALTALFLHGFVEYQFGSGQVVLLYAWVIGCIAAGRTRVERDASRDSVMC